MVACIHSALWNNNVAASIDTPLHAFFHSTHRPPAPDWASHWLLPRTARENGRVTTSMLTTDLGSVAASGSNWHDDTGAVKKSPGSDGIVLGGHGLFTWGDTQRECYVNTITIIDQLGNSCRITLNIEEQNFLVEAGRRSRKPSRPRPGCFSLIRAAYQPSSG